MTKKNIAEIKTWFDRINGNSYFSARIYDLDMNLLKVVPFQYGYGSHPRDVCITTINSMNEVHQHKFDISRQTYFNEMKSLKRDCVAFGEEE
jgi:hypothetical protein